MVPTPAGGWGDGEDRDRDLEHTLGREHRQNTLETCGLDADLLPHLTYSFLVRRVCALIRPGGPKYPGCPLLLGTASAETWD
jgi:hypothetical protein